MRALMIDNYDSFTYNLVQYLQQLDVDVTTYRNDAKSVEALIALRPHFFVLSPGPSTPDQAGVCLPLITAAQQQGIPLLGVCLGHQAIGQAFGGKVVRAALPIHGKVSRIMHRNVGVFRDLPPALQVTRYHSLIVERNSLPKSLQITAETEDGTIMGLRHENGMIEGLQFHPESVLTEHGVEMLANFVNAVRDHRAQGSSLPSEDAHSPLNEKKSFS